MTKEQRKAVLKFIAAREAHAKAWEEVVSASGPLPPDAVEWDWEAILSEAE